MPKGVAKQCCGLTFTDVSDYKEHLEVHELEPACGWGSPEQGDACPNTILLTKLRNYLQ